MTVGFNHLGQLGQLGNQMFQYAITKSVASKLNVPFKIPNHQNVFDDGIGNRYTILLFNIFKLEGLTDFGFVNTEKYVQEGHFHYDETIFDISPQEDFSLWGFFQSEKYFKDIENDIRDDFKFKDELVSSCQSIIENVDNPIALHIRRGDFITNSQNHPPLPLDYYKRALKFSFIRSDPLDTRQSYTALKLDFWRPGNATLLTAELATIVVRYPDEV